ncbi:MAG: MMPL family transporter [Polyangiales bacterium]|nr:MMPL family transporter [Sandaracinaceae bacterium]
MIKRFTQFVTLRPRATLLLVVGSMLLAGFLARNVRVDNNFAQLFATDGAASDFRETYRQQFGADDGVLVAVLESEQAMDARLVPVVERIGQALLADENVTRVYSVTETSVQWRDADDALVIAPAFGEGSPFEGTFEERLRTVDRSLLGGNRLVSSDGRVFLVAAELRPEIDTYETLVGPAEEFQALVQRELDAADLPVSVSWAGIPFTRLGAISTMQGDLLFLAPLCTAVLAVLLLVFLRRFLGMLVSLLCITVSTVLTAGVIGLAGDDLNQITFIYPILLMVVVVANAVHFLQRYRVEREGGLAQAEAVHETTLHVTRASFLTSLTTAIGFASLYAAEMHVLRGFGLYLAAGVMMSFVVVSSVLPACLSLLGDRMVRVVENDASAPGTAPMGAAGRALERFLRVITRRPVAIATSVLGSLLLVGLLAAASGIVYDYRISDNVYADHPISVGNRMLDEHMAGIVPVEVSLLGAPGQMDDPAILRRVDALGRYIESHYEVARPISLASVVRQLSTELGGEDEVADDETTVSQLLFMAEASPDRIVDQLVNADRSHTRLRSSTRDGGARYIVAMQTAVEAEAARLFEGTGVQIRMTGEAPVAYQGMNRLSQELVQSVAVALFFVVLAIGVVFRSGRVALASILPNALPVAVTLALYSLSGAVIDPLPGIAFCIGIGMSVDDTVHLLAGYRTLRARGLLAQEAVVQAVLELRSALVSSSVVLACGFFILMLSDFNMNQMMGLLGGTLIALALLCDLVFTPALLAVMPLPVPLDADAQFASHDPTDVSVATPADGEPADDALPPSDSFPLGATRA